MSMEDRRQRLLALLDDENEIAPLLLDQPADIRWLTGLNSSNAVAILSPSHLVLATDNRYAAQARALDGNFELVIDSKVREAAFERFTELVQVAPEPVAQPEAVARARAIKDDDELVLIRQACEISVEGLTNLLPQIRIGLTEVELARMLELEMAKLGAEDRAFATIVAAGPNSAIPHHAPTSSKLLAGDLLKIDFGARVDGYNADCTRSFIVGAEPEDWQLELHAQVLSASEAAKRAVRPGLIGAELDAVARDYLLGQDVADQFLHGLGHGVGLDIHEYPFLIPNSVDVLEERSVFTIEPGLYVEGSGGIRIEDTCALIDGELVIFTDVDRSLKRVG
ncbi:MAG: M24 family metallopeptidase [Candidatus Nanopelagicales bacterium]